jgi:CheY-like chemotaxis protein
MTSSASRPVVLLAEDSEDDAFFFRWTLQKSGLACDLIHATDGIEAVRVLEQSADAQGRRTPRCPDLVFLDLKMPGQTGFEVLEWIRQHPFQPPLDVAVLSGSEHTIDIERAKSLGASGYYVKPIAAAHLMARFKQWQERQAASPPQPSA